MRIGLVGGGSDIPDFFKTHGGAVLGLTFEKYVYVAMLPLADIAPETIRFTYRYTESAMSAGEIEHPVVRAALSTRRTVPKLNIATMADLPGGTGLGSSSAFTAALLGALEAFDGRWPSPDWLARKSISIERDVLREPGGWQDQVQTAFGGLRLYEFANNDFTVSESINYTWVPALRRHLVLAHTGLPPRRSGDYQAGLLRRESRQQVARHHQRAADLARKSFDSLRSATDLQVAVRIIADSVRKGWEGKLQNAGGDLDAIDAMVREGIHRGASAGKLLGAGGGGFVLFVLENTDPEAFMEEWPSVSFTPVVPESLGTRLVLGWPS